MSAVRLVILGGGESGVGAALLGKAKGLDVFLSEGGSLAPKFEKELTENDIPFETGGHTEAEVLKATEIIKSPGIPQNAPIIRASKEAGVPIISEIEFASRFTLAKIIAITGSNGKTTTSLLTYDILKKAGISVALAGNVGPSFSRKILESKVDVFVLEISSFQLDDIYDFHADVAVLLNITPDHLDRYGYDFDKYAASKYRIVQNQKAGDSFIFYADSDPVKHRMALIPALVRRLPISLSSAQVVGGYFSGNKLCADTSESKFETTTEQITLQGPHSIINTLAAILASLSVGVNPKKIPLGLKTFKNAAHRLEPVTNIGGVLYINDSKATNVDSVLYALQSFNKPIVWIAGGVDKGNDYTPMEELVTGKVKALIALGKDNKKLIGYFETKIPRIFSTESLEIALAKAKEWANEGDVVLLSPAAASFDLFKNYEDRGDRFKEEVFAIKNRLHENAENQ